MDRRFTQTTVIALSLALSACAQFAGRQGDATPGASVTTPAAWTRSDPAIRTAAATPESLAGWWRQFGDVQLDALIAGRGSLRSALADFGLGLGVLQLAFIAMVSVIVYFSSLLLMRDRFVIKVIRSVLPRSINAS